MFFLNTNFTFTFFLTYINNTSGAAWSEWVEFKSLTTTFGGFKTLQTLYDLENQPFSNYHLESIHYFQLRTTPLGFFILLFKLLLNHLGMKKYYLFWLLSILWIGNSMGQSCRVQDSLVLRALYDATGGATWTNKTNWLTSNPIDTWYGIQTNANGCVTCIDLDGIVNCSGWGHNATGNNLVGSIPPSLVNLSQLQFLSLAGNQLTGTIPTNVGNLTELRHLNLAVNQLTGTIPTSIGNLPHLQVFNIGSNRLNDTIPTALGNCANMLILYMNNNQLTGSLPPSLGNMSQLVVMHLASNQLTGPIPSNWNNFPQMTECWLQSNQLSGSIPNNVGSWGSLEFLILADNQLTGSIPSNLAASSNLLYVGLATNQLTGTIPNFTSPRLLELVCYGNQLSGEIPNFNLPNLTKLALSINQLSGAIPNFALPNLQELYLRNNQLTGKIPNFNFPQLQRITIESNRFTHDHLIPNFTNLVAPVEKTYTPQDSIFRDTTITQATTRPLNISLGIDDTLTSSRYQWSKNGIHYGNSLNHNRLIINNLRLSDAGVYTCRVTNPNLPLLSLWSRNITLVVQCAPVKDTTLTTMICGNRNTRLPSGKVVNAIGTYQDTLRSAWDANCDSVRYSITISNDNSCRCQDSIQLVSLYNATNGAGWTNRTNWLSSSSIENWYGIRTNAQVCVISMDLRRNLLAGNIPNFNLPQLSFLQLEANQLSGSIPNFNQLPNLTYLALDYNQLSGNIPDFRFLNLTDLYLHSNQLTGNIPNLTLPNLQHLYLNNNQLSGCIPAGIKTNCPSIGANNGNISNNPSLSTQNWANYWNNGVGMCGSCPTMIVRVLQQSICQGSFYQLPSGRKVTVAGSYSDTLRSILGCDSLITGLSLIVNPLRYNTIVSPTRQICQGNSTIINGQQVFTSGNYTEYDTVNCVVTIRTIPVVVIPQLTISTNILQHPTSCSPNGIVQVLLSGGLVGYNYPVLWSNGYTNLTVNHLAADTYTVTVTDHPACNQPLSASVTLIAPPALTATVSPTNVACFGQNNGSAAVAPVGVLPYRYLWTNNKITSSIDSLIAGTYTVTITDAQPCTIVKTFIITQPIKIRKTVDTTICEGAHVRNHSITGIFRDTLRSFKGCDSIITLNLRVLPRVSISIETIRSPTSCLVNGSMRVNLLGGIAGYNYSILWSNGSTNQTINNLAGGTYSVTVTDNSICNQRLTDTFELTAPAALVATVSPTNVTCYGKNDGADTVKVLGGVSPYTYLWNNNQTTAIINGLIPNIYSVTVTDAQSCTVTRIDTITQPNEIRETINAIICEGDSVRRHKTAGVFLETVHTAGQCDTILTIDLKVIKPIRISISPIQQPYSCTANGSARVNILGGETGYNYPILWSRSLNDTNAILNGMDSIRYWVTVTDHSVCNRSVTASIQLEMLPPKDSTFNWLLCKGQRVKLPWGLLVSETNTYYQTVRSKINLACDSIRYTIDLKNDTTCRCKDSLQLVAFRAATTRPTWVTNWVMENNMSSWAGITLTTSGCVQSISLPHNGLKNWDLNNNSTPLPNLNLPMLQTLDLSGNNLVGTLPPFDTVPALQQLYLNNNKFSGNFPKLNLSQLQYLYFDHNRIDNLPPLTRLPSLLSMQADYNRLTFDDVLPNLRSGFTYANQDTIFHDTILWQDAGTRVEQSLGVDDAVRSSIYEWYRNGATTPWKTFEHNKLIINQLTTDSAGEYICRVTNPLARNLTLQSRRITVRINCAIPQVNRTAIICQGASYRLPDNRVVDTSGMYRCILRGWLGCDSVIVVRLTVNLKHRVWDTIYRCELTIPQDIILNLTNRFNCDSTVYQRILPGKKQTDLPIQYLCEPADITPKITTYKTWKYGCDSIVIQRYQSKPSYDIHKYEWVCDSSRVRTVIQRSSTMTYNCDSIVTTHYQLAIKDYIQLADVIVAFKEQAIGVKIDSFKNQYNCDSFRVQKFKLATRDTLMDNSCNRQPYVKDTIMRVTNADGRLRDILFRMRYTFDTCACFKKATIYNGLIINDMPDGKNDFLVVKNLNLYPPLELIITDKRGMLLFQSTKAHGEFVKFNNDWHGEDDDGHQLPEGIYNYILRIRHDGMKCVRMGVLGIKYIE
jgi:Leucine-rich repeat (LRR) protein